MNDNQNPIDAVKAAERALLGSLMLDSTQVTATAGTVTGPMFLHPTDETLYNAIVYTHTSTGTTDPIVVSDYLTQTGEISSIPGGASYLHHLIQEPSSPALAPHYAKVIATAYQGRTLNAVLAQSMDALTAGLDPTKILATLTGDLDALQLTSGGQPTLMGESLVETTEALHDGLGGVPTGIRDFDTRFGGLGKSTFNLIAARPGMGKTVVGLTIARQLAKQGIPVLFFSLEMSKMQMMTRVLAAECKIPTDRLSLVRPRLTEGDWQRIDQMAGNILNLPLYIDAESSTLEAVTAHIKTFKRTHQNPVIIIDYIGLLGTAKAFKSETEQMSHISKALKQLSRAEDIPLVALAQLNRTSESRSGHIPQLSDLRSSGSLEQDADNVYLLYREDYYEPESPRAGELDVIGAKVRAGAPGTVALAAQLHYMTVCDMASD